MTTWIATNFGGNFSRPDIDLHPDILGPGGQTRLVVVGERPMTAEEQTMVMQGKGHHLRLRRNPILGHI